MGICLTGHSGKNWQCEPDYARQVEMMSRECEAYKLESGRQSKHSDPDHTRQVYDACIKERERKVIQQ